MYLYIRYIAPAAPTAAPSWCSFDRLLAEGAAQHQQPLRQAALQWWAVAGMRAAARALLVTTWLHASSGFLPPVERIAKSKQSANPLYDAAREGDAGKVDEMLAAGSDVNERLEQGGWQPIHAAAQGGHDEVIRLLLEYEAEVNSAAEEGWTALHWAAHAGHTVVIGALADGGAKLDKPNDEGWTALHICAHAGHGDAVEKLLDLGATLSVFDKEGWPPLHWAAHEGQAHSAMTLLQHGAVPQYSDKSGWCAIHVASRHGHVALLQPLLHYGGMSQLAAVTADGRQTPLHLAALHGHASVVIALLNAGSHLEAEDRSRRSALQLAAQQDHTAVIRALVDAGADVDRFDSDTATALHGAAYLGHAGAIGQLLGAGADAEATNQDGFTPLHFATSAGQPSALAALLRGGANFSAVTGGGLDASALVEALAAEQGKTMAGPQQGLLDVAILLSEWAVNLGIGSAPSLAAGDTVMLGRSVYLVRPLVEATPRLKWTKPKKKRLGTLGVVQRLERDGAVVQLKYLADGKLASWPIDAVRLTEATDADASSVQAAGGQPEPTLRVEL